MEKCGLQDYTQHNMVDLAMLQLPLDVVLQHNIPGVPLQYAPEPPRLKKTWMKKSGKHISKISLESQMAEMFFHKFKQLDKLTKQ